MSPAENIINWIQSKPLWWQFSVKIILACGKLSQNHFRQIYSAALNEHGILNGIQLNKVDNIQFNASGLTSEEYAVTLDSIKNVINVGALAKNQTLSFNKTGLTIIYGDNGSGKSSYSKIIKHACLTRGGAPEIIGNIFNDSNEDISACITIKAGDNTITHEWNLNSESKEDLKSIRVFDSHAASHFVSKEDVIGYKPTGLHILEELAEAIDYVNRQITEETMGQNGLIKLPAFNKTRAGKFIEELSETTDPQDAKIHCVSDEDINRINVLDREIADYISKSPEQIRKETSHKIQQLSLLNDYLKKCYHLVDDKSFSSLKIKENDFLTKNKIANELRERTLSDLPLANVGGSEWRLMWNSAKKYLASLQDQFPPTTDGICPLCQQKLEISTLDKLSKFESYINDDITYIANESKLDLNTYKGIIENSTFDLSPYAPSITVATELESDFEKNLFNWFDKITLRQQTLTQAILPEHIEAIDDSIIQILNRHIGELQEKQISTLSSDTLSRAIDAKRNEKLELLDKKLFSDNLNSIISNIERLKIIHKYNTLQEQCKSRPITDKNSELCKKELIDPLVNAFNAELAKFGFHRFKVKPKTRGKAGTQLMKLEILDGNEPLVSKIASEGEQRCLSIACFLAEMSADKRKSAVVFDDPVNSLSHQWTEKVAKRLVDESRNRQVIVFTHNIVFYKLLLEQNKDDVQIQQICLVRNKNNAGFVRPFAPWEAQSTSARIRQLHVRLRELTYIYETDTDGRFKHEAASFYCYLREAWERLIEEKLFNQVITRFGRSIQTQRLKTVAGDISQEDYKKIDKAMTRCSNYFIGHDSALEISSCTPSIEDIKADLHDIEEFNTELQKNRKRN